MLPPRKPPALNPAARVGFRQGVAAGLGARPAAGRPAMRGRLDINVGEPVRRSPPVMMSEGGKACKTKKGKKK